MLHLGFDKRAFRSFLFLGVFFLLIFGGVMAIKYFPQLRSRASGTNSPSGIQVINVTQDNATITWTTTQPTTGFLAYGDTESLGHTKLDDRDVDDGLPKPYRNHIVTLSHLAPKTKYFYTIG